jgi:nicotinamide riboside transporter PnuC
VKEAREFLESQISPHLERLNAKAWAINGTILAFVTWQNAESALKCLVLVLTAGMTAHRWIAWARKPKSEKED